MKKQVLAVLIGATIVALGLGAGPALAVPGNTDNNGNHYGWSNGNGQNYSQYSGGNYSSVPEPASLILLGAGLAAVGIARRMGRKS